MPPVASDSPSVAPISQNITVAASSDTNFPPQFSFKCAVTDSKGPRRFMEDAHTIVVPFGGIRGQGFFAIFDGHAGKQAAEWCGQNFALFLLEALRKHPDANIPDILNQTFHNVDSNLSRLTEESDGKMHSGCTAVTAFLRLEDANGKQSFLPPGLDILQSSTEMIENQIDAAGSGDDETSSLDLQQSERGGRSKKKTSSTSSESIHRSASLPPSPSSSTHKIEDRAFTPAAVDNIRRVLYCANAGDARGVLCRGGKAVRLTYDHKGSDKQEAKRIMDAGGFVMSGRVNGVLAVTRALGDSSMKEFVVGAPYTTETELCEEDEFLILACDGLWDVVDDQPAVDLVRGVADSRKAAEELLDHAFSNYSSDNVTVMVIRFRNPPANVKTR